MYSILIHFLIGLNKMIVYNVTVSVKNSIVKEWLEWMKNEHIPELMNTEYFSSY
jgi:hypothetical protein